MAAAGLAPLVLDAAMAQFVALAHDTADTDVIPSGTAADDHVSVAAMAPERITGTVVPEVVLEPIATHTDDEGQVTWEIDELVPGTE
jgi:hypothetical protein